MEVSRPVRRWLRKFLGWPRVLSSLKTFLETGKGLTSSASNASCGVTEENAPGKIQRGFHHSPSVAAMESRQRLGELK